MTILTAPMTLGQILKGEVNRSYSRDTVTILSGPNLALGSVVSKIKRSVPTTGTADSNIIPETEQ